MKPPEKVNERLDCWGLPERTPPPMSNIESDKALMGEEMKRSFLESQKDDRYGYGQTQNQKKPSTSD